jgi:hypothetical protein
MVCNTPASFYRKQFFSIKTRNTWKVNVKVIDNRDATDYFNLGEPQQTSECTLYLNINGTESEFTTDKGWSNILSSKYHAYAEYDIEIHKGDLVKFDNRTYRVDNYNISRLNGQIIYKEFDLIFVNSFVDNTTSN